MQGADPGLRDREVQRLVDELLGGEDRTLALEDHTIPARRRRASDDDAAPEPEGDGTSLELPAFAAVTNALQSPPFMTAYRVVVVREIGNLTTDQAKWLAAWIAADPDETAPGARRGWRAHAAGARQGRQGARARSSRPRRSRPPACSPRSSRTRGVRLAPDASDATRRAPRRGRGPRPRARRGARSRPTAAASTLGVDDVEVYLGDVGTAGRFDLTNAIDRGDVATALEVLHRLLTATSTREPKPLHPLQVMATLVYHYQRLLRLDDPSITTKEQAAEALGMKSAGGARFPLEASKRLGYRRPARSDAAARAGRARPPRVRRARRAHRDRRARRAAGRAQPPALTGDAGPRAAALASVGGSELRLRGAARRIRRDGAPGGLVLVDDALGAGLAEPLLRDAHPLVGVLGTAAATPSWATLIRVFSSERTPLLRTRRVSFWRLRFF